MESWFTERQTNAFGITMGIRETLLAEKTSYQDMAVLDTHEFGRMLVLDGMVMTTTRDEFVYHEMMVHPALFTHANPRRVLVIGGGDGGVVREVLKHPQVERVVHVEIDGRVIECAKAFLPEIAAAMHDPRVELVVGDGYAHIQSKKNEYDVALVDSTEPIGPAVKLFERSFFQGIFDALREDGMFVAQTDTPWFKPDLVRSVNRDVRSVFPIVRVCTANVPTYPSGLWTFHIGSKQYDPEQVDFDHAVGIETKYYSADIHRACFVLPRFVEEILNA